MSALLLDTHAWIWLMAGNPRLGVQARSAIQQAANENLLYVSAISPWEVAMLVSKERLILNRDVGEWVQEALSQSGIRLKPLSPEVAVASTRLSGSVHPDPADRIIVATARHLDATLVTDDRLLLDYGSAGHLSVLVAGR